MEFKPLVLGSHGSIRIMDSFGTRLEFRKVPRTLLKSKDPPSIFVVSEAKWLGIGSS